MKKVAFFVILCSFLNTVNAQKFSVAKMDSLIMLFDHNEKAMGQLTISKNGHNVYSRAWGYSQLNDKVKKLADVNTKYRIGSISKMFTATMILQLVEEGKLTLETNLADYFPQIPNAKKITIEQLLNHHSGVHNFTDDSTYLVYYTHPQSRIQMLGLFEQQKADFQPGEKAAYSNTNYLLLAYIVEDITHLKFKDAIKVKITDKVGLKNTYVGSNINNAFNEATSFLYDGKNWIISDETDMSITIGAGNIVSTTDDLDKFITALFQGKLIKQSSLEIMTSFKEKYGLGVFQFPFYKRYAIGHTGGIDGFNSMLGYFPDDSSSFAIICNGLNYRLNDIALGALSIFYNKKYELPIFTNVKIDSQKLNNYVGVYSSSQVPLKITITLEAGHLTAKATGQSSFPLEAENESKFKFEPAGVVIEFAIENEKKITQFHLKQGGGDFLFEKE